MKPATPNQIGTSRSLDVSGCQMRSVLSAIKPSKQELLDELKFSKEVLNQIKKSAPKECSVVITGSIAKRTFLRDGKDLDIFVLFDSSVPKSTLEDRIKAIMADAFPSIGYQISYAEHPYIRFHLQGRVVDLVPAYRISRSSDLISAVDRSVLHTKFVKSSLKEKQIDEVLLLKAFLKANSLYGAEMKIQGFSGYLCELLIIKYGSFRKLAQNAAKWKPPVFVDIKKYYKEDKKINKKGKKRTTKQLNERTYKQISEPTEAISRFGSFPFVVVDPTDKNRNVAAALAPDNLKRFSALCRQFIKKPSEKMFLGKPPCFDEMVEKISKRFPVFLISLPRPEIVDDVLWGQLRKLMSQMASFLADFRVSEIFADDTRHLIRIAIALETDSLPPMELVKGPPVKMKEHVMSFRKSHKGSKFTIKKKVIYAAVKRRAVSAGRLIADFFREFQKAKSHLSYHEELVIVERMKRKR